MIARFACRFCTLLFISSTCIVVSVLFAVAAEPTPRLTELPDNTFLENTEATLLEMKAIDLTLKRLRSDKDISPEIISSLLKSLTPQKHNSPAAVPRTFAVPDKPDLAALTGTNIISVKADLDGQFAKNIQTSELMEKERLRTVDDANLNGSILASRGFSRESLASLARTEQAKAQTGQAFALLLPSISLRASYGAERSEPSVEYDDNGNLIDSDTHSRTDYAITLRQPLFDLPGYRDWRRRQVLERARADNFRASDGDAYLAAVNAYLSLVSSRLQIDMTRNFENQLNDLFIYIEKRAGAGAASIADMSRVLARSQETLSTRLEQEAAHAAAGIEFVRVTNLIPQKARIPSINDVGAALLPQSFEQAVTTAMQSNPEITALAAEVQAAYLDKSTAQGRFLPRIEAELSDTYSQGAGGDNSAAGQKDRRAMLVLNWSLFSGGGDYQYKIERIARHKELQYRLDDQRRRVIQALSANYATLTTTRERITSGYKELKSISTAAEAMSKRMLSGNQSLLDLLDVYDRFYQARSRLLNLHILEMSTITQLVRLIQGTPDPLSAAPLLAGNSGNH